MEKYRLPIWVATILGCVLIIFVILLNIRQFQLMRGDQFLSVSATAKVEAVQDLATVTVGVISEGSTAKMVKDQSNSKMNQIIAFIKQTGVEDKDIKTSQFYISPHYSYENQQQTLVGYQANQTITIKVRNINKSLQQLENVVDGVIMHGANQINGIDFSFEDNDGLFKSARKLAIDKAKVDAQQIAKDAGLYLGRVVNVITSGTASPQPMFAENMMMGLAKSNAPQIELGSQEVFASVTVVFAIH